eukprot:TRINITY_DN47619_c0_g1_i1.p2 TRINITY_DN47619_c0_g1~~TRINITY_DN47619_c0_g1_i1.p2  ORF type:complete len:109 (+),score=8.66 TRINITY_DN47619_c0_g1_i1:66-392(+)
MERLRRLLRGRPPAPTGMAALRAKRPERETARVRESEFVVSAATTARKGIVVLGVLLGFFSCMSLVSSRHYGNEAKKKQATRKGLWVPDDSVEPAPLPRSVRRRAGWE